MPESQTIELSLRIPNANGSGALPVEVASRELPIRNTSVLSHLDQYFGLWAVEEERFLRQIDGLTGMDWAAHAASIDARSVAEAKTRTQTRIGIVEISGTMTKYGSSLSAAGSTIEIRRAIRNFVADGDIDGILLKIDSPGGSVSGTMDLAEDVRAADARKPVFAFIEDLGASAAYWVASQARRIYVNNNTAMVGSVGTFAVLQDLSGYAAQKGIKVHVIRSGQFKGAGTPGTEITAEQMDMVQRLVLETQRNFNEAIVRGRGMTAQRVNELADGRVHIASDALSLSLIDGIEPMEAVVRRIVTEASSPTGRRAATSGVIHVIDHTPPAGDVRASLAEPSTPPAQTESTNMAEPNTTPSPPPPPAQQPAAQAPRAATLQELKAVCPGAESDFIVAQLEKGATAADAQKAFIEQQRAGIESRDQELEKLKADAAKAAKAEKRPGVRAPLNDRAADAPASADDEPAGDATEKWNGLVAKHVKAGKSQRDAVIAAARENPELREEFVAEHNARFKGKAA